MVLSATWLWLYHHLSRHGELRQRHVTPRLFAVERLRALLGIMAFAAAGVVGWLVNVPAALVVLLLLPFFYGLLSNGFYDCGAGCATAESGHFTTTGVAGGPRCRR